MATRDLQRLQRLGARVKSHRLQQYASRDAAAAAAEISKDTWQRVEEGRPVRESSYAKIDGALGWAVGSCLVIADGGEPILAGEDADPAASRPTEEEVRKLAFEAATATMPAAPVGEIQAFVDRLVKDLRGVGEVEDGE